MQVKVITPTKKPPEPDCPDCNGTGKWKGGELVCPCTADFSNATETWEEEEIKFIITP